MSRAARMSVFFIGVMMLGVLAGAVVTFVNKPMGLALLAQVQQAKPLLLKGGRVTVPANAQAFLYCEDKGSQPVNIVMPNGSLQVYEFTYEWALSVIGQNSFPGKRLTIVDGQRSDAAASDISQFTPGKLYYMVSSVALTIDCSKGIMESGGSVTSGTHEEQRQGCVERQCPRLTVSPGCRIADVPNDANGCAQCPFLVCGGISSNEKQCPIPSCSTPLKGCHWSMEKDAMGCITCGVMVCGGTSSRPIQSNTLSSATSSRGDVSSRQQTADASCEWKWPGMQDFSRDGSLMTFHAFSDNPVMGGELEQQIFLYNTTTRSTIRLTDETGNTSAPMTGAYPKISGNGNVVVFTGRKAQAQLSEQRLLLLNLSNNSVKDVTSGFSTTGASDMSNDGRYVLVNNSTCLYLYDSQTDSTTILAGVPALNASCISSAKNPTSTTPLNSKVFALEAVITGNGKTVFFTVTDCNPANPTCQWNSNSIPTHSLYRYEVGSNAQPVRVGAFDGYSLNITEDGSKMYFLSSAGAEGQRTAFMQDTAMQSLATQINAPGSVNDGGLYLFTVTSNGNLMSYYGGSPQSLRVFGPNTTLNLGEKTMMMLHAPLSSDGRFISYTDTAQHSFAYRGSNRNMSNIFVRSMGGTATNIVPRPGATCSSL